MMHLVIGSVYQWGIINVYITSYFSYLEGREQSLTVNGAVFPAMMMCMGLGMKIGNYFSQLIGISLLMTILSIVMATLVFGSSYLTSFGGKNWIIKHLSFCMECCLGSLEEWALHRF